MTGLRRAAFLSLCGAAMALPSPVVRADSEVFDNGADLQLGTAIGTINQYHAVSDDFTLASGAILTRVVFGEDSLLFGAVVPPVPLNVDWSIGSAPFSASVAAGTAGLSTSGGTSVGGTTDLWSYSSSFALPSLALGPGTYWLTLGNGTDSGLGNTYWSASNAKAGDAELLSKPPAGSGTSALDYEMAFQLYAAPEPGTLGLVGLASAALALRRLRR